MAVNAVKAMRPTMLPKDSSFHQLYELEAEARDRLLVAAPAWIPQRRSSKVLPSEGQELPLQGFFATEERLTGAQGVMLSWT